MTSMENTTQSQAAAPVFDYLRESRVMPEASKGLRFANFVIDFILFYIATFVGGIVLGIILIYGSFVSPEDLVTWGESKSISTKLVNWIIGVVIGTIFYTLCEGATKGRSVGKYITRTRAVRLDGSPIAWRDAFLRSLCRFIPFEPFSAFSARGPWHDRLTKTMVVPVDATASLYPQGSALPPDA